MKTRTVVVLALVALSTAGPIAAVLIYERHRSQSYTAEILARAPERGNFAPRRLEVAAGEPVRLRVRNVDTVTHGFAIPALGIEPTEIKAGHVSEFEFTPRDVGEYDFYCTVWCSEHHLQMRGILAVVPGGGEAVADAE